MPKEGAGVGLVQRIIFRILFEVIIMSAPT